MDRVKVTPDDENEITDQVGAGLLDTGDLLTPDTVRRLACDAQIIPAVLAGDGQILDLGRARRLIDGPLRRALMLRDKGSARPGRDRPARWRHGLRCEDHSATHFIDDVGRQAGRDHHRRGPSGRGSLSVFLVCGP